MPGKSPCCNIVSTPVSFLPWSPPPPTLPFVLHSCLFKSLLKIVWVTLHKAFQMQLSHSPGKKMVAGKSKEALLKKTGGQNGDAHLWSPAHGKLRPELPERIYHIHRNRRKLWGQEAQPQKQDLYTSQALLGTGAFLDLPTGIQIIGLYPLCQEVHQPFIRLDFLMLHCELVHLLSSSTSLVDLTFFSNFNGSFSLNNFNYLV